MATKTTTEVKVFIDLPKFAGNLGAQITAAVALNIKNNAQSIVRKDSGNLRDSIKAFREDTGRWRVEAQTEYAAAQEYGLAEFGKPNYGFTPYMRPAAKRGSSTSALTKIVTKAAQKALAGALK